MAERLRPLVFGIRLPIPKGFANPFQNIRGPNLCVLLTSANVFLALVIIFSRPHQQRNQKDEGQRNKVENLLITNAQISSLKSNFTCSPRQLSRQDKLVKKYGKRPKLGCAEPASILPFLHALWSKVSGPRLTFVNVGANKGFNIAEWLEIWAPGLGFSPAVWGHSINGTVIDPCGGCKECKQKENDWGLVTEQSSHSNTDMRIFAVEPLPANVLLLNKLKRLSGFEELTVIHAAAGEKEGVAFIANSHAGDSQQSLQTSSKQSPNVVAVNVTTVDNIMSLHDVEVIHWLEIDAEGYDPAVLRGAQSALREGRILVFQFEYNWMWPKETLLKDVVAKLEGYGYDCYLKAKNGLVRLSGCFVDSFEFRYWSNVICNLRRDVITSAFFMSHSIVSIA